MEVADAPLSAAQSCSELLPSTYTQILYTPHNLGLLSQVWVIVDWGRQCKPSNCRGGDFPIQVIQDTTVTGLSVIVHSFLQLYRSCRQGTEFGRVLVFLIDKKYSRGHFDYLNWKHRLTYFQKWYSMYTVQCCRLLNWINISYSMESIAALH